MARARREVSESGVYHWIARGINKKRLFHSSDDYDFYINLINKYAKKFSIDLYHFCIMENHVHLVLRSETIQEMSQFSHYMGRCYARYYITTHNWHGQVFTRNFKSFPIEKDSYLIECGRYIERNPVRANICSSPEDYFYSSYLFYAEGKRPLLDLTPSPTFLALHDNQKIRQTLYSSYVKEWRINEHGIDSILTIPRGTQSQLSRGW